MKCEVCGVGNITCKVGNHAFEFRDTILNLASHYTECDECECEYATAEQVNMNAKLSKEAKKSYLAKLDKIN